MEFKLISAAAVFCICFLLSFSGLKLALSALSLPEASSWRKEPFWPLFSIAAIAFLAVILWLPLPADNIYELSVTEALSALAASAAVYFASFLPGRGKKYSFLAIPAAAILLAYFLPPEFLLFDGNIPLWADRLLLVLFWSLFSGCLKYLNGLDGLVSLQLGISAGGITILAFLGAAPFLLGIFGIILTAAAAALQIFNAYPARLSLNTAGCRALGFLLGWLIIRSSAEGAGSCSLCFAMFFIYEIAFAAVKKISLKPENQNLLMNTAYYQANLTGLSPADITRAVARLMFILLILGCFQTYAPNAYSLPLLCLLVAVWFDNRLRHWQQGTPTLAEINKDMLGDLKDNLNDLKNNLRKDD